MCGTSSRMSILYRRSGFVVHFAAPKLHFVGGGLLTRTVPRCCMSSSSPSSILSKYDDSSDNGFTIMDEKVNYQRYQTIYERLVRYPNGKRVSFDVYGNPASQFKSVFVVPYNTKTKTVTLLREYTPGTNGMQWGFIAGGFDPKKHTSLEHAARMELSEEAFLKDGTFFPLTDPKGVSQDKYSKNMFHMYLALNPVEDLNPAPRDAEEFIEVVSGVSLDDVLEIMVRGGMNLCSGFCGYRFLDILSRPPPELRKLLH